ncbi:hypothetical protein AB1Y20_003455 [Prymnesium parvum]|uniref:Uncharacterized protein n=1 Tax=Prymnesium parvum TaxID=97485 RepID=A0AB34JAZ0_PRYPA
MEATTKRPAEETPAEGAKKARAEWMGKPGDGGTAAAAPNPSDLLKKTEKKQVISSIASKLSAPRATKASTEDARKQKVGSFSAGLTKEKLLESQQRHKEKCEASGKPVPYYRSNH